MPKILKAGDSAGVLTEEGAKLLDPTGKLGAGAPFCPPEGDMQTGMVCSDAIAPGEANFSAGTSCNIVIVLEKPLNGYRKEIDVMLTPEGYETAMIHGNNCTSEIDSWVKLFGEVAALCGARVSKRELYDLLYGKSLEGDADTGGVIGYNYLAGEAIAGAETGALLIARKPSGKLSLANFMQMMVYSAVSSIALGMDILAEENVVIDKIYGHGGFFKTEEVGQRMLSAAINAPVSVMQTAGEGGPYGMAILCAYALWRDENESLEDYLDNKVFADCEASTIMAEKAEIDGFNKFIKSYKNCLEVEKAAVRRFL